MAKIKLITINGYGTENNPAIGGSEKVITLTEKLAPNEHVRAVVVYDFDKEYDEVLKEETQRASDEIDPVVPYESINGLVARLLQHVDAAFSDKEQRKAVRSLIMNEAWQWYHSLTDGFIMEAWRKDKYPDYATVYDNVNQDREVK